MASQDPLPFLNTRIADLERTLITLKQLRDIRLSPSTEAEYTGPEAKSQKPNIFNLYECGINFEPEISEVHQGKEESISLDDFLRTILSISCRDETIEDPEFKVAILDEKIEQIKKFVKEGDIIRADKYGNYGAFYVFWMDGALSIQRVRRDYGLFLPEVALPFIFSTGLKMGKEIEGCLYQGLDIYGITVKGREYVWKGGQLDIGCGTFIYDPRELKMM